MADDEYCERSDLPATMCAHCRGLALDDPEPFIKYRFFARREGQCQHCKDTFRTDDYIGRTSYEGLVCEACADRLKAENG